MRHDQIYLRFLFLGILQVEELGNEDSTQHAQRRNNIQAWIFIDWWKVLASDTALFEKD